MTLPSTEQPGQGLVHFRCMGILLLLLQQRLVQEGMSSPKEKAPLVDTDPS